jgi:hypothetical protein
MIYDPEPVRNGIRITMKEFHAILELRLSALDAATVDGTLLQQMPVTWRHGLQCRWWPLKRDQDGSLLVILTVSRTGQRRPLYERSVRLVPSATFNAHFRSTVARD